MQNTLPDSESLNINPTLPTAPNKSQPQAGFSHGSNPSPRGWGGTLFVLFLIAVAFGSGWMAATARHDQRQRESLPQGSATGTHDHSAVMVTVEPVRLRSVQRMIEALGTLHGFEEVSITARVEGRVRKVFHDVSDRINPAERLLEIDPTEYELAVQQADRALQVELAKLGLKSLPDAKMNLVKIPVVAKAQSLMEHAKSRQERIARLAATKNASAEDAENAASDYRTAQAEYDNQIIQAEAGLATIEMKKVELMVAREHLANTRVSVPTPMLPLPDNDEIAYVVSQRSVSEGTVVRPGMEIFRIVICQTLKLRVPVPERHSSEVKLGQQVQVHTAATPTPFPGTVTRIYPTVDPMTRTFQVEIQVPNSNGELKPGSFAKAAILTRVDSQAVTVPLPALVQFAGITKVFLVENGHAREIPVTLGVQTTEWVEIVSPPLSVESQVITSGQTVIANETPVVIRDPETKTRETDETTTSTESSRRSLSETKSRGIRE